MKEYCPCGILVAPQDPEQKVFRGKVWHNKCFQKEVQAKSEPGKNGTLVIRQELTLRS